MSTNNSKHQRYTIQQIKQANTEAGRYFFERSTMRYFGNSMRDFKVWHVRPKNVTDQEVYIIAMNHNAPSGADKRSVYRFDPESGDIRHVDFTVDQVYRARRFRMSVADIRMLDRLAYEQS